MNHKQAEKQLVPYAPDLAKHKNKLNQTEFSKTYPEKSSTQYCAYKTFPCVSSNRGSLVLDNVRTGTCPRRDAPGNGIVVSVECIIAQNTNLGRNVDDFQKKSGSHYNSRNNSVI